MIAADAARFVLDGDRIAAGIVLAAIVAVVAWRLQMLSMTGAVAAWATGAVTAVAGWAWCVVLLTFFCSSAALSRWRRQLKARRTANVVTKMGARDAWQVAANGGVFVAMLALNLVWPRPAWGIAALGAMAAATADTWATEIGTALGRDPWSLRTRQRVVAGTSGAITTMGTAGFFVGAAVTTLAGVWTGLDRMALVAAAIGGVCGAFVDTLLGATIQERRWCTTCQLLTEQATHACGTSTTVRDGWPGMTNDLVNLACTASGALAAVVVWRWFS